MKKLVIQIGENSHSLEGREGWMGLWYPDDVGFIWGQVQLHKS